MDIGPRFSKMLSVKRRARSKNDYQTGTGDDYTVVLDSWRFGKKSEIKFNIENCDDETTITVALCAIPYFQKRKNPNPMCELHLTIHPTKKGSMQSGIPEEENHIPTYTTTFEPQPLMMN